MHLHGSKYGLNILIPTTHIKDLEFLAPSSMSDYYVITWIGQLTSDMPLNLLLCQRVVKPDISLGRMMRQNSWIPDGNEEH